MMPGDVVAIRVVPVEFRRQLAHSFSLSTGRRTVNAVRFPRCTSFDPARRDRSSPQGWDRSRQIRDKPHARISHMPKRRGRATCGTINRLRPEFE
jgi:hypothetical protein